jgi:hypothetical protein
MAEITLSVSNSMPALFQLAIVQGFASTVTAVSRQTGKRALLYLWFDVMVVRHGSTERNST